MRQSLPAQISSRLQNAVEDWTPDGKIARPLWNRDKTLWTGADEDKWLGWFDIADRQLAQRNRFQELANRIKSKTYTDVVLLGINGSSLCPKVLSLTVGHARGNFDLLAERRRRALRVHIPADLRTGLAKLQTAITEVLN